MSKRQGLDRNQRRALDLFEAAKKARASGIAVDVAPLRVRLAKQVDLGKASPDCKRCYGTGIMGHQLAGQEKIPIICRCVVRNGGVQADQLDRILEGKDQEWRASIPLNGPDLAD